MSRTLQKVSGGWWWAVVESDFSVKLWPRPSSTIMAEIVATNVVASLLTATPTARANIKGSLSPQPPPNPKY